MPTAKTLIKNCFHYLLDLIYPKECVGCGREGFWLCPKCQKEIIAIKLAYCPNCKTLNDDGRFCKNCRPKYKLSGIKISGHYKFGPLREAIHRYKYDGIFELEDYFRPLLIARLKNNLPQGDKIVVPIPLYYKKEMKRGFNQAERLGKIISQEFNLPLETKALTRAKETEAQMSLKKKERRENIAGAFRVITKNKIKNKTVLLVDDVATTGLTLNEAAKVLLEAGAKKVWGVVIAQG